MKETPERIQNLLKEVVEHFDKEDRTVRESQIRTWRKLKLYWEGLNNIWYSEVAHDWRIWDQQHNQETDEAFYDKRINVFRAYLESIIAALSVTVPGIECTPDDADDPLDIQTARAGKRIAELVFKHNDAPLLWLHALFIFCTEGMVACYNYTKEDEKYGTYEEKEYKDESYEAFVCPECNAQFPELPEIEDEFQPGCPECNTELPFDIQKTPFTVTRLVGVTTKPKSRQCIEMYGGLYVKVPNYAMKQSDIPYLIWSYETNYVNVLQQYPHLRDKIKAGEAQGVHDPYERWGRLSPQYNGEYPVNNVTCRNAWLRPAAFNILQEDDADELKKKYPDGAKVVLVNDQFADAENAELDDCWTITKNPLSDYIHHDPLGLLLVSIQDITNDLVSLTVQTIEHGIPQTFADPDVLNFEQYRQTEVIPGGVYPAKAKSGKRIGDSFHEVKTSTLSGEVMPFARSIQEMAQLVSGALPSLFGGAAQSGSKTAAEYGMSRAQALQRLQTTWKILTHWWKEIFGKVIPAYIKDVVEDERYVEKTKDGNYVNVFIRKAELEGRIGSVELEASEQLPITWAQMKDVVMELMQAGNPIVMEAIQTPENLTLLKNIIGLNDFVVPGESDRIKQYEEIKILLNTEPQDLGDGILQPSVPIDPIVDDHQVEFDICRNWLVSDAGRLSKVENPAGYQNVLLHAKMHMEYLAQAQAQMMAANTEQPNPKNAAGAAPIPEGDKYEPTIQ